MMKRERLYVAEAKFAIGASEIDDQTGDTGPSRSLRASEYKKAQQILETAMDGLLFVAQELKFGVTLVDTRVIIAPKVATLVMKYAAPEPISLRDLNKMFTEWADAGDTWKEGDLEVSIDRNGNSWELTMEDYPKTVISYSLTSKKKATSKSSTTKSKRRKLVSQKSQTSRGGRDHAHSSSRRLGVKRSRPPLQTRKSTQRTSKTATRKPNTTKRRTTKKLNKDSKRIQTASSSYLEHHHSPSLISHTNIDASNVKQWLNRELRMASKSEEGKFWCVGFASPAQTIIVTRFGAVNSSPRTSTTAFATKAEALKHLISLVKQKLRKGYR